MPYHVPFNQRNTRKGGQPPVYIGFEPETHTQPPVHHQHYANQRHYQYYQGRHQPRPPFNWSAFWGLMLSILAPFTAFLLAPLALLLSLRGLGRAPRGMATVGTLFSLCGTAILGTAIFAIAHEHHENRMAHVRQHQARVLAAEQSETSATLDAAATQLEKFKSNNQGMLPAGIDGNLITIKFSDAWGNELRYEAGEQQATIRSAGPDREFDSRDDLVTSVAGSTQKSIFATTPSSQADAADAEPE